MAYVARHTDFQGSHALYRPAASTPRPPRRGLLRRAFDAIMEGRQKRVQREIERFVGQRGRRMTDSLEREINARMFQNGWNIYR